MRRIGVLYHAGGLGDFVLSLPAIFRVSGSRPELEWRYWGPADRLRLLPGFSSAPAELVRSGYTLWGDAPQPEAVECLKGAARVLAFGGRELPRWTDGTSEALLVSSFPSDPLWVPLHQREQLDRRGLPRLARSWLPAWRQSVLPAPSRERIVLHPGSGDAKKNLRPGLWKGVVDRVRQRLALPVLVLLGPAEVERGGWEQVAEAADEVRACASVADLLRGLSGAAVYLGNDSGVSHLSAALGIPSALFFGPSDPRVWKPLGESVRLVTVALPCAPCTSGGVIACREPICLSAVSAEELAAAALSLVEEG